MRLSRNCGRTRTFFGLSFIIAHWCIVGFNATVPRTSKARRGDSGNSTSWGLRSPPSKMFATAHVAMRPGIEHRDVVAGPGPLLALLYRSFCVRRCVRARASRLAPGAGEHCQRSLLTYIKNERCRPGHVVPGSGCNMQFLEQSSRSQASIFCFSGWI